MSKNARRRSTRRAHNAQRRPTETNHTIAADETHLALNHWGSPRHPTQTTQNPHAHDHDGGTA